MAIKLTRRTLLKGAALAGGGFLTGSVGYHLYNAFSGKDYKPELKRTYLDSLEPGNGNRPNIVLIMTDDQGYGDLSCYGSDTIDTPNIDGMAERGARMTNFYASAPICSPSRAGMLTGRYPIRTHMNDALLPSESMMGMGHRLLGIGDYGIPEDEILISEVLKKVGYKTALIGKWHLGDFSPFLPNDRGFDLFYGHRWANDFPPFEIYRNEELEIPAEADQTQLTANYTRESINFIEENRRDPFFLFLSFTSPHIPLFASERFRGRSEAGRYGDTIEEIDWSVGQVLETLTRLGLEQNTLVLFTSDNGPWYQGSAGELRGRKRHVFEGGFKVPCIAQWPGTIPEGRTVDQIGINFDIFSTCLNIAGVEPPEDRMIDGVDMLPLLTGSTEPIHERMYYYWRTKLWALRQGNWKYHRRHEVGDINPNPWPHNTSKGPYLFNLETDPTESYSMLDGHGQVARRLSSLMDEFDRQTEENIRGWV